MKPLAGSEHLRSAPGEELVVCALRMGRLSSLKQSGRRGRRSRVARALMVGDHRAVAAREEAVAVEAAAVATVGAVMQGEKAQRNVTRVTSSASNAMAMGIMLTVVRDRRRKRRHHARAEMEPSVLYAELELSDPLQFSPQKIQKMQCLSGGPMQPELYFTGNGEPTGEIWYLDNGASNHMTGDRNKFKEIDPSFTGKVRFGDGSAVEIQGIGSIVFQGKTGDQWVLRNVYFIPKLRANLISLGKLTEIGHRVVMDDDEIIVSEKNPPRWIMCVQRIANRLYKIELNAVEPISPLQTPPPL